MSYIKVDELYKLASRRAILDRESFLESMGICDLEVSKRTEEEIISFDYKEA